MQRADLFLGTVDDLKASTPADASEYRVLMSTLLLRKLLLDDARNLTDQVKVESDLEVFHCAYAVVPTDESAARGWGEALVSGTLVLDLIRSVPGGAPPPEDGAGITQRVDRPGFLALPVAQSDGELFTVRDVIHYGAYVAGGIHAGVPSAQQRRLDVFVRETEKPGLGPLAHTLRGIAFTTWEAMLPIATRLRRRG